MPLSLHEYHDCHNFMITTQLKGTFWLTEDLTYLTLLIATV